MAYRYRSIFYSIIFALLPFPIFFIAFRPLPLSQVGGATPTPTVNTPIPNITSTLTSVISATLSATLTITSVPTETPTPLPTYTPTPLAAQVIHTPLPPNTPIWDIPPQQILRTIFFQLLISALILGGAFLLARLVQSVIMNVLNRVHPNVRFFAARVVYISIWIIAVLWVLSVFNVQTATVTAVVGTLGLALGLASQDLAKNFIAGLYLLLERPFVIGDIITIGSQTGRVDFIDLRTTIITTSENEQVIIPNTMFMSQVVTKEPPGSTPEQTSPE